MTQLYELTGSELLQAYHRRDTSPVEVVEALLDRIEATEPAINAIVTLCADRCLQRARDSQGRWKRGDPRPLEGLPFGLKDIIATEGIRTTGGSSIYADNVPTEHAEVMRRLEEAGGLLLAKLQTFEFAMGDNSHYGPTRSPWAADRSPGGSSTGSAAALAAGEMPLAVGTDTGGSIRVPSTFCGVAGFKPTLGRISRHGVMFQSWTLDHVGPMARSVEDVARMTAVMAGHDARDPASLDAAVPDYLATLAAPLRDLRIGVPNEWFWDLLDPDVERAARTAIEVLRDEGATIVEISLPTAHQSDAIGWVIMYAEYAALHEATLNRIDEYSAPLSQQILASSPFVSAVDYVRALRAMHLLQQDFEAAFQDVEAILVPGMAGVAPRLEDMRFEIEDVSYEWGALVARMTMIFNIVGSPALAIPAGLSTDGLPVGIQIASRPLNEVTCLRVGYAFQRATDHHRLVPVLTDEPASSH